MFAYLIKVYTDPFYEVEEGTAIVMSEEDIKPIFTQIKIANPRGFLHIFAEKFEVGKLETGSKEFVKEYKR